MLTLKFILVHYIIYNSVPYSCVFFARILLASIISECLMLTFDDMYAVINVDINIE